jgi:hypothetical protein
MSNELQTTNTGIATSTDAESIKIFRESLENFTSLLNRAPKKDKIQKHQGYEYLPISVVEKELDRMFFGLVQYECISYTQIFNEIACHARIKVFHPVVNQWMTYDGLGSAVIQQDANTKVIDFHQFKKPNALQLNLPKAYAEAIKNAAKKIGKRFGSDINRKFEDEYTPIVSGKAKKSQEEILEERQAHLINDAKSIDDLAYVKSTGLSENLYDLYDAKLADLKGI